MYQKHVQGVGQQREGAAEESSRHLNRREADADRRREPQLPISPGHRAGRWSCSVAEPRACCSFPH